MRKQFTYLIYFFLLFLLGASQIHAQVSGKVFKDFNANGTFDTGATYNEVGQAGVEVKAYDPSGAALAVTYTGGGAKTNNTGEYSVASATPNQVRLEFILPDSYTFASKGSTGGTTVMFPTTATQDLAVNAPEDFSQSNPTIASPVYVNGYGSTDDVLIGFPYNSTDHDAATNSYGNATQMGATWGIAFQRSTKTVFASAFVKRHVGLGPLGVGGIYKVNSTVTTHSVQNFVDVASLGIDLGTISDNMTRGLLTDKTQPNYDVDAFALTGKIGIGDMDISSDDKKLFFINLKDKKLYSIVIDSDNNPTTPPVATDVKSYTLPTTTCNLGVARPWAIDVYRGKVYVGVVCTGENGGTTNDLSAFIYAMDETSGIFNPTPVYSFPLTYPKLNVEYGAGTRWLPWTDTQADIPEYSGDASIRPEPILADIDFDVDGSMILTFNDRSGHQLGYQNFGTDITSTQLYRSEIGGDILRIYNNNGVFELEHNGIAGAVTGSLQNNNGGPGTLSGGIYTAPFGEFYDDLTFASVHEDCPMGGSLLLPGSGQVMVAFMDPINWRSGGFVTWNNTSGSQVNRYEIYTNDNPAYFGKANGIGDVELLSDAAPIEIGNRVFMDTDSDGEQDAGEMGLDGIKVELWKAGAKVTDVTTANGGQWFFGNLDAETDYEVKILAADIPSGKQLTTSNAASNAKDLIDNDATLTGSDAVIAYKTGSAGQNNHSLDFGFKTTPPVTVTPCATPPSGPTAKTCSNTRLMATPIYVNGDPLASGTTASQKGIVIFEETNFGESTPAQKSISSSQVGSVWGMAYKEQNNTLYTSAFLKRHMGLGTNGTGAIYKIDPTQSTPSASLFVDLTTLGVSTGANPRVPSVGAVDNANELPANTADPSWDVAAFNLIGKTSLGGLDISTDGTKMYVMNLHNKELVAIDISGAAPALIGKYPIPDPGCSNAEYRPWAVKAHSGKVYVGVVCSAETSQQVADLKATVLEFNGTSFCEVYSFSLDYPRGIAGGAGGQLIDPAEWKPWTSTWQSVSATFASEGTVIYPQPILSDIEFDTDGSMILAFLDRNGHQTGVVNYKPDVTSTKTYVGQTAGDILRVGLVGGVYQLENNGQVNGVQAQAPNCFSGAPLSGNNNQQGPGGGEYYWSDNYAFNPCNTSAASAHEEISFGGLAFVPGSGEIAITGMDPTQTANSGGVSWFNNTTGKRRVDNTNQFDLTRHGYRIYDQALPGGFGKAAGLGDLEVFCAAVCTKPTTITFTKTAPTCTGATANNNGKITFTSATNADKYFINTGATSTGTYATATVIPTTGTDIQTSIPNAGATYTIRFYNGTNDCFKDTTITVDAVTCVVTPCAITLIPTVSGCYQNAGTSKSTVSVEVKWENATVSPTVNDASDAITVTFAGQTKTINPGAYTSTGGNGTIVSPQVVAFEVDADASTQTIQAFFGATYAASTCKNEQTGVVLPAACPPLTCTGTQTGGQVFNDYNADGIKQSGETSGLNGVTVKAFDCNGNQVATTTTDINGKYVFAGLTAANYPIRVEFSGLPALYGQGTPNGINGRTTTQFVSTANCNVDLGVLNQNDYCQNNPKIFIPSYAYGDPLPNNSTSGQRDALLSFQYGTTGLKDVSKTQVISDADSIGTLWGLAYNKYNKLLYGTAMLKRHAGLGPKGLGGLYVINPQNNSIISSIDLSTAPYNIDFGAIPSNVMRGLDPDPTKASADSLAFAAIGKVGIGDLDISEDGQYLYLTNLFDNKLYKIGISGTTPVLIGSYAIPSSCVGGNGRSFGLKSYRGKIYVGTVCDAFISQNKSDLRANVQEFNPVNNSFSIIFDFPLTYPKGSPFLGNASTLGRTGWYPWTDNFNTINTNTSTTTPSGTAFTRIAYPQPMFTDIEFDIDGSMVLGFGDRTGLQTGFLNVRPSGGTTLFNSFSGGDILRAVRNEDGIFIMENNAKLSATTGYGAGNNQGPGFGEFYNDDYLNGLGNLTHSEIAYGALALRPGSGQVIITGMDPINQNTGGTNNSGGIRYLNNNTGNPNSGLAAGFILYNSNTDSGTFGKATGLGDIELGCNNPIYLEIGNYVWFDTDKDGVQDPCEKPIENIKVSLYKDVAGTLTKIVETTTSPNGEYYFSDKNKSGVTWTGTGADTTLLPTQTYKVVFGETQYTGGKLTLNGVNYTLTTKDATTNSGNDQNDSDASEMSISGTNYPSISVTTGAAGSVNHTLDAGFYCAPIMPLVLSTTAPTCTGATANNNGKITFTSATNADKYFINTGVTSTGTYATATAIPASGTDLQTSIPNAGETYTIRFYNGADACFKDTTIVVASVVCTVTCVPPIAGTNTPAEGTCTGTTPNDDATVAFTGVTGALKADKVIGNTYTGGPNFGDATNADASTGDFQLTGLKHGSTYTIRIWQTATCFVDVQIETPTKTCTSPCPPKICTPVKVTKL
jgi:SdrD B-like domain